MLACSSVSTFQSAFADFLISPERKWDRKINETPPQRNAPKLSYEQNASLVCTEYKKEYFRYLNNRGVATTKTQRNLAERGMDANKKRMEFICDTYISNRLPYTREASQTDPDNTLSRYHAVKR